MKKLIYENKLSSPEDTRGFMLEGDAVISFEEGALELRSALDESLGQKSNFVYWCPEDFPADIEVTWKFSPIKEPGLCIMFFAAKGCGGEDIFGPGLQKRNGEYELYHSGDINCYHVSYFRRKWESERAFHTCNLRKSRGFHLVCQGADPIPDAADSKGFYDLRLTKLGGAISFFIDGLLIFHYADDGTLGPVPGGGKLGFRQMAPLIGRYKDLSVFEYR